MTLIRRRPETLARLAAEVVRTQRDAIREQRRLAFQREADPLFFEMQRGEASPADYEAKVAEIRGRLPYPTEP